MLLLSPVLILVRALALVLLRTGQALVLARLAEVEELPRIRQQRVAV